MKEEERHTYGVRIAYARVKECDVNIKYKARGGSWVLL